MKNQRLTFVDAIALCLVSAIMMTLLLPVVIRSRASARSQKCAMNLKVIGLALHNYHSTYKMLPKGAGGTTGGEETDSNQGRLGPLVALLPFVEKQELWEQISNHTKGAKTKRLFPRMGPAPWYDPADYRPWGSVPENFLCPENDSSDRKQDDEPKVFTTLAMPDDGSVSAIGSNYVACYGDGTHLQGELAETTRNAQTSVRLQRVRAASRGIFGSVSQMRFRDCLDGLSNTLFYSESISGDGERFALARIATNVTGLSQNPSLCLTGHRDPNVQWWDVQRGARWCDGALAISGFQTVLPPNSPSCLSENGINEPIASVSSRHDGGVHALFADGSVQFIGDEIDCGDSTQPGVSNEAGFTAPGSKSPYGVWGALGSRAAKEMIAESPHVRPIQYSPMGTPERLRRWTDNTEEIYLSAKFVRMIDNVTVELEDSAGDLHRVPLNTLSDADIVIAVEMSLETKQNVSNGSRE